MNEKIEALYDEMFNYLKVLTEYKTTSGVVPEVARVLMDLIVLESQLKGELR